MDFSDIDALREKRAETYDRAKRLNERAVLEKRDLTPSEQRDWDRLLQEVDELGDAIETKRAARERAIVRGNSNLEYANENTRTNPGEARILRPNQRLSNKTYNLPSGMQPSDVSMGRYIKGLITGRFDGAPAEEELAHATRTQGGSNAVLGGFLVPQVLSDQVIDLARNKAAVIQAGAGTFEMQSEKVRLARLTADPVSNWRVENSSITNSTATFGAIDLRARSLASLVPVSRELLADASNAASVIENSMAASIALAIDYAALRGNGAAEQPTGLRYTTSVALTTSTGGTTGFASLSRLVKDVYVNNFLGTPEALALIYAPRTAATYGMLIDGQGQPLRQPDMVAPVRKFQSNQIPTSSTTYGGDSESEVYVGDFSQLLLAVRSPLEIQISNDYGFNANQVYVRTIFRGDIAVTQPTWFSILVGTTA